MRIKINGDADKFFELLNFDSPKLEISVTATVEEFNNMLEEYHKFCCNACNSKNKTLVLTDNQIFTCGKVTDVQTDCFPVLLTLKNGNHSEITVAITEPLASEFEHRVKIGDFLQIWAVMKPKYRNGDFYYDLRLTKYKVLEREQYESNF